MRVPRPAAKMTAFVFGWDSLKAIADRRCVRVEAVRMTSGLA
jgi:hypothetical protein